MLRPDNHGELVGMLFGDALFVGFGVWLMIQGLMRQRDSQGSE
jgi:hypothetical protein